jgi:hypothetical protein
MTRRTTEDTPQSAGQCRDRRLRRQFSTDCDDLDVNDGHVRANVIANWRAAPTRDKLKSYAGPSS